MTIIHRRVFYAKVGNSEQLVQHFHDAEATMNRLGIQFDTRIMTDYLTGRSDRVAVEWTLESMSDLDSMMEKLHNDPQSQAEFGTWLEKLNGLILYSEAESWMVR